MILIVLVCLVSAALLLMLNSKYLTSASSKAFTTKTNFFNQGQDWFEDFIPSFIKLYIDRNIFYTNLDKKSLYKDIFYSILVSSLVLIAFFYTQQSYYILIGFLSLSAVLIDFTLKVDSGKKSFIDSLDHLVFCLEILTVKSETPLSNALKIIIDSLPSDFFVAKNELNAILVKAEKLGMEQVLNQLERDSVEEQEFISILQSIQKGTNKSALKKNLQDFLYRQKIVKEEKRKMFVENMQLYLMLPGTIMLIIAMYPLIDMILFQLGGAF
jgi:hypothetical protein